MGTLHYGSSSFPFDDRLLAHLQLVIGLKLRRSEDFFLTWRADPITGEGRHAIWIDNGVPIHFEYFGSRPPSISRDWVESLSLSAASSAGLVLGEENSSAPD